MSAKKARPIRASILYHTDISAIPDIDKVWATTNKKFPDPKRRKKVTIAVPEDLFYLAGHLAKTHSRTSTNKFLSIALTEVLYDAYLRVQGHINEKLRAATQKSKIKNSGDSDIPFLSTASTFNFPFPSGKKIQAALRA